jgi:hypothetical protein
MSDKDLSDEEIKNVVDALKKLEPGFLPLPIFHEVTRLTATPIIEVVPLRRAAEKVEILLLKRDNDDPVWPNQLHAPGTVLRATDSIESALERITSKELTGIKVSKPKFVTNVLHHSGRGMETSQVYWVNVENAAKVGQFYDVEQLPENLVKTQLDFIPQAIKDYKAKF